MNVLALVLFASAGLLVVMSLSTLYATNVTFWKGRVSPWSLYLLVAAALVSVAALLIGL